MDFKIGDRVECIKGYDYNGDIIGKKGTVIRIDDLPYRVGVQFDTRIIKGHNCGHRGKDYHCWNVGLECLKKISDLEYIMKEMLANTVAKVQKNGIVIKVYNKNKDVIAKVNTKENKIIYENTKTKAEKNYIELIKQSIEEVIKE